MLTRLLRLSDCAFIFDSASRVDFYLVVFGLIRLSYNSAFCLQLIDFQFEARIFVPIRINRWLPANAKEVCQRIIMFFGAAFFRLNSFLNASFSMSPTQTSFLKT